MNRSPQTILKIEKPRGTFPYFILRIVWGPIIITPSEIYFRQKVLFYSAAVIYITSHYVYLQWKWLQDANLYMGDCDLYQTHRIVLSRNYQD